MIEELRISTRERINTFSSNLRESIGRSATKSIVIHPVFFVFFVITAINLGFRSVIPAEPQNIVVINFSQ